MVFAGIKMRKIETQKGIIVQYAILASRWSVFSSNAKISYKYIKSAIHSLFCIHIPLLSDDCYFYLPSRREFVFYGNTKCKNCRIPMRLEYGLSDSEIKEIQS